MLLPSNKYPTLFDLANSPDAGSTGDLINMMVQTNPILEDAMALPANHGTFHETTVKTGLPSVTWGRLYKGIPASKGTMQTVKDTMGFVNSAAEVDQRYVDIYEKAEEKASIRAEMAQDHLEAMAQEAATAIFYHDSSINPDRPTGFAPRFNSKAAENGKQIIDAGGVGSDNTSIWMITWDRSASHLIYPKNYVAGLQRKDRGLINKSDVNGDTFFVYREEFVWHFGLSVRNWQYVTRIANIDVSDITTTAATGANLVNLLTEAYYAHHGRRVAKGKTFIYMNTALVKFLDYQTRLAPNQNLQLTWDKVGVNAKEVLHFRGVPIRETDALLSTEDRVV